jgi:phosphocarrier protein HPr
LSDAPPEGGRALPAPLPTRTCTIVNSRGLHARAAAKFVRLAATFDAEVIVERDGARVPATSILGLMMLAAARGSDLLMEADGAEAEAALAALVALVENGFDETD